jgi:hypothetical protein
MSGPRRRCVGKLLAASLVLAACSSSTKDPTDGPADGGGDAPRDLAGDGDVAPDAGDADDARGDTTGDALPDAGDGGYASDGPCLPGLPRCHGDFGYQMCEQDGTWSESHSCAGYSSNGTTSYCAEIPMAGGGTWATCVDPACWYWLGRGALGGPTAVGICQPDGSISACSAGGTLAPQPCAGVCTSVTSLDGRAVGYCAPACEEGASECLDRQWLHRCTNGRWGAPETCGGETQCVPVATGAVPAVRCGAGCDTGTSICNADGSGVLVCDADGTWTPERTCLLGRCRPAGPQAECETQCAPGERRCAFDGAGSERVCGPTGLWMDEAACATGTSCRLGGAASLGCVECAGDVTGGGNAFGVADGRCSQPPQPSDEIQRCGPDNHWQAAAACEAGSACTSTTQGPSSAALCRSAS